MGRGAPSREALETAILSRLRTLDAARCAALPDASGGLGERLLKAAAEEPTWDAVCAAVKNKRLAMARVRRNVLCAALGVESGMAVGTAPYARLLAATARGRAGRGCGGRGEDLFARRGGARPVRAGLPRRGGAPRRRRLAHGPAHRGIKR